MIGGNTRTRIIAVALLCLAGGSACHAQDATIGRWKLNEAKSKFSAGAPVNKTALYEVAGDNMKVTLDGTGADGKPSHTEWAGKLDGKDYPISGTAAGTRAYTRVDEHTMKFVVKSGSRLSLTGRIVISPDGKTRTVTARGNDEGGKKIKFSAVYDKQ